MSPKVAFTVKLKCLVGLLGEVLWLQLLLTNTSLKLRDCAHIFGIRIFK